MANLKELTASPRTGSPAATASAPAAAPRSPCARSCSAAGDDAGRRGLRDRLPRGLDDDLPVLVVEDPVHPQRLRELGGDRLRRRGRVQGPQRAGKIPADKKVKFVAFGGDGGTYDIGLQSLSGAMERGHDMVYVCYDNGAYMNTGIQRSSATPCGAWATTAEVGTAQQGKTQRRKDLTSIIAAHGVPYAAQASVSHWQDLTDQGREGVRGRGPGVPQRPRAVPARLAHAVQQDRSRSPSSAVQTGFWPLFEVEDGEWRQTVKVHNRKPIEEFLKPQGRFKHLFKPENAELLGERPGRGRPLLGLRREALRLREVASASTASHRGPRRSVRRGPRIRAIVLLARVACIASTLGETLTQHRPSAAPARWRTRCEGRSMALVVTKFGGTSVGSTERIRAVADRLDRAQAGRRRVVAVVSAMGTSPTSSSTSPRQITRRAARARDGHAALDRRAGLDRAARDGDPRARATTRSRSPARRSASSPTPSTARPRSPRCAPTACARRSTTGKIVIVAGFQGMTADGHDHHARPRRLGHHRRRRRRGHRRRRLRDLHRRRRRLHRRPAHRARRAQDRRASPTRRCSRWRRAARACCRCARSSSRATTAWSSTAARRFNDEPGTIVKEADETMEQAIISGVTHDTSEAKVTIRDVPDRPGVAARGLHASWPRPTSTST